jgi:hypothetical protein
MRASAQIVFNTQTNAPRAIKTQKIRARDFPAPFSVFRYLISQSLVFTKCVSHRCIVSMISERMSSLIFTENERAKSGSMNCRRKGECTNDPIKADKKCNS